jgi:hypothetical protein
MKQSELEKMFEWTDSVNPRELSNTERIPYDGKGRATPFMDSLLRLISGHVGATYRYRDTPQKLIDNWNSHLRSEQWNLKYSPESIDPEAKRKAEALVKDGLIVDLGCGVSGEGYAICDALSAEAYLGNEAHFAESADRNIRTMNGRVPFRIVQSDMGEFLHKFKEMPWKARSILFSGIDDESYSGNYSYSALYPMMAESLEDKGKVLVAGNFGWLDLDSMKTHFELVDEIQENWGCIPNTTRVYQKK